MKLKRKWWCYRYLHVSIRYLRKIMIKLLFPLLFYQGHRAPAIQHARLRMHCSSLKEHLYSKNIINSPLCLCGGIENTTHYLLFCPLFNVQRTVLLNNLPATASVTTNTLLFGMDTLDHDTNSTIFEHVQHYITTTKRFTH